jgi:probable addiction module antidote protein
MGKMKTKPYDSTEYLDTAEDVAAYLEEAFAERDPALIAHALGVAARARGMTQIAKEAKLSRESLYRALSPEGNPELSTLIKVLHALGLRLAVEPEKANA